jgi:hypothetical protein
MDAIYQCFKKNDQVEFVLENFFKNGGDKVYLLSDAGNDFSYLKEIYKDKLIYKYNNEKTWCDTCGWSSKSQALYWMIWYTEACRQLSSDYIILLEDDVYVRGNLNEIEILYDIMGPSLHCHNQIDPILENYLNTIDNKNISLKYYGGCGGTIMNRKIIAKGEFPYLLNNYYDDLLSISHKIKFSDALITVLYRLSGCIYGANKDYTETWLNPNWMNTTEKIIHQYEYVKK